MRFLLLLTFLSFGSSLLAQQPIYEKNWFCTDSGQIMHENLHYDPATDVLTVRKDNSDLQYSASQVEYFSWDQQHYFSLPLNNDYSFFRVLYDGGKFAVLHKQANLQLLQYFVQESEGTLSICEDEAGNRILCERQIGPGFGIPVYSGSSLSYKLEDAVFILLEGKLHLVNYKYDTKGELFATVPGLKKQNRRILKRLKEVIQNEQELQRLRKYVASTKSNLQDPEQLILALKAIYP